MTGRRPKTPLEDLAYLTECTLATVEWLAMKTRPPVGELDRQRSMAEFGILALLTHGYDLDEYRHRLERCTRVEGILRQNKGYKYGRPKMPWTKEDAVSRLAEVHARKPGKLAK